MTDSKPEMPTVREAECITYDLLVMLEKQNAVARSVAPDAPDVKRADATIKRARTWRLGLDAVIEHHGEGARLVDDVLSTEAKQ